MMFGHDLQFWVTVSIAALIKWLFSTYDRWRIGLASLAAAIFIPWLFTRPVLDWMALNPDIYTLPTAGLLAWGGEQLIKAIISLDLKGAIALWRGSGK